MLLRNEEKEEDQEKEHKIVIDKERIPKNLLSQVIYLDNSIANSSFLTNFF